MPTRLCPPSAQPDSPWLSRHPGLACLESPPVKLDICHNQFKIQAFHLAVEQLCREPRVRIAVIRADPGELPVFFV
jgi:hypothetical protein